MNGDGGGDDGSAVGMTGDTQYFARWRRHDKADDDDEVNSFARWRHLKHPIAAGSDRDEDTIVIPNPQGYGGIDLGVQRRPRRPDLASGSAILPPHYQQPYQPRHRQAPLLSSPHGSAQFPPTYAVPPQLHIPRVATSAPKQGASLKRSRIFICLLLLVLVTLLTAFVSHFYLNRRVRHLLSLRGIGAHYNHPRQEAEFELSVEDQNDDEGELVWVPETGWTRKKKVSVTSTGAKREDVGVLTNGSDVVMPDEGDIITPSNEAESQDSMAWVGPHLQPLVNHEPSLLTNATEAYPFYEKAFTAAWRFRSELRKYADGHTGEEVESNPLVVSVVGQPNIMRRDLPLIRRGYDLAYTDLQHAFFQFLVRNASSATAASRKPSSGDQNTGSDDDVSEEDDIMANLDLVLCLSLATCSGKDDDHSKLFENNPGARVNRIPNLRQVLWSKQNFCRNLPRRLAEQISFPCWVIPDDERELLDVARNDAQFPADQKWIAKPWSSGGGHGISVIEGGFDPLRTFLLDSARKKLVVQPFLDKPLLINNRKVDLRVYVLVTSTSPLRAYVHRRGLVRFASQEYGANVPAPAPQEPEFIPRTRRRGGQTESNPGDASRTQFLTNTSVNKKESNVTAAELTWPFSRLWVELGTDRSARVKLGMDRAIALLLLSVESKFKQLSGGCDTINDGACYHLLGFDVMLSSDATLAPKIIEVNGEPSFAKATHSGNEAGASHYDETKLTVARDIARLVFAPLKHAEVEQDSRALLRQLPKEVEGAEKLVTYLIEVTREHSKLEATEFRLCYPSVIAAVYPDQNKLFEEVLAFSSPTASEPRKVLHRLLNDWIRKRVREYLVLHKDRMQKAVESSENDDGGSGLDSVMRDIRDVEVLNGVEL